MKKFLLFILVLQTSYFFSYSQQRNAGMQTDEMKKMIAELKKEVAHLEMEIKKAQKEDPDAVASLETQLKTYKTMISSYDKMNISATKPTAAPTKKLLPQTPSPILKVHLKQPVAAPSAVQAKDHFFWYKGKKINDSTLVTTKKTIVQYSRKRNLLIVQPDENQSGK